MSSTTDSGGERVQASGAVHALLIGIDRYRPSRLRDGMEIRDLSGAVNDVLRIEAFLRQGPLAVRQGSIRKLLAPGPAAPTSRLAFEGFPTYRAIIRELGALTERAAPGDQVVIHYSGHGARVGSRSTFKEWDECLVPSDAGEKGDLLRDVELYGHLLRLASSGLHVTLLLDACHSGGLLRKAGRANERTIGLLEGDWGPEVSPVGGWDALREQWARDRAAAVRHVAAGTGPFPVPEGCVMIAACRPLEVARECFFDGVGVSGALTNFLLEATDALGADPTVRQLHRRLLGRIHSRFESQTPVLEGDPDVLFLGRDRWSSLRGVSVLEVRRGSPPAVRLATGRVQGVASGARFALRPPWVATDGGELAETVARATEVDGGWTWAKLEEGGSFAGVVDAGWNAVLIDPGPQTLVRAVGLEGLEASSPEQRALLDALCAELRPGNLPIVEGATDDRTVDFRITWADGGDGLEVLDGSGEAVAHQGAPIPLNERHRAVAGTVQRLEHLATYRNLRDLENPDRSSPLHGALELELREHQKGRRAGGEGPLLAGEVAEAGQTIDLVIRNRSNGELNVVVLDFQPDWGICQAYPDPALSDYDCVAPGGHLFAPLDVYLPDDLSSGRDLLRVFATTEPVDFSWLTLPPLRESAMRHSRSGLPEGPLERLFAMVASTRPATRSVRSARVASGTWTVAEIELTVVQAGRVT